MKQIKSTAAFTVTRSQSVSHLSVSLGSSGNSQKKLSAQDEWMESTQSTTFKCTCWILSSDYNSQANLEWAPDKNTSSSVSLSVLGVILLAEVCELHLCLLERCHTPQGEPGSPRCAIAESSCAHFS